MGKLVTKIQSPGDIFEWAFAPPHQSFIDLLIYSWMILAGLQSIPKHGAQFPRWKSSRIVHVTIMTDCGCGLFGIWLITPTMDMWRSAACWKIDRRQCLRGNNGACCEYVSSWRAALCNYSLDSNYNLDSNYSEFMNNVPLTREVTESWGIFRVDGSGWVSPGLDRSLCSSRTVAVGRSGWF